MPPPLDTSPEIEAMQIRIFRSMTVEQHLEIALEISLLSRALMRAGVQKQHPSSSVQEIEPMMKPDLFRRIATLFERAAVPYMLIGSFAGSVYGMHRGSPDIDFIIAADEQSIRNLLELLPEYDFSSNVETGLQSTSRSMFTLIDNRTGMKIDFIFQKRASLSHEQFQRRKCALVGGVKFYIAAPEDVVLSTMQWAKIGTLHRQIEDVEGILKVQNDQLDLSYIEKWVAEFGLLSQWNEARRLAK
jgi:predicted nucleotidyltransferase